MLPARHPPRRAVTKLGRQPAVLGWRRHRHPPRGAPGRRGGLARGDPALDAELLGKLRSATTRPSPSGSRTTGTGTGTTATTPATPSAAGCATTRSRSGCSPRSRVDGRTTAPSRPSGPSNGTRPSRVLAHPPTSPVVPHPSYLDPPPHGTLPAKATSALAEWLKMRQQVKLESIETHSRH